MSRKLELESLLADLATLDALLARSPKNDYAGRIGLSSRRREVEARVKQLQEAEEERMANVAIFFGGRPVVGSRGIKADFAGEVIFNYQDLISKIWATDESGQIPPTGPIKDVAASHMHVTEVVHGSFGFVLEELDELGEPLFRSALKDATARATDLIVAFASAEEADFEKAIEAVPGRVFSSLRDFLKTIHREDAVFRMVEGDTDASFDESAVERAYRRAEAYSVEDEVFETEGKLLGLLPDSRRFELQRPNGEIMKGKVGAALSADYLERIEREDVSGKRWKAKINRRLKKSFGKENESFTLLDLARLESPSPEEPS